MISHRSIGHQGRLGNQMFQYASTIGIALKNNYQYCFDLSYTKLKDYFNITAQNCRVLNIENDITTIEYNNQKYLLNEDWERGDSTKFNIDLFNNPDNISYHGFLQSPRYFEHCSDLIRKEYEFRYAFDNIDQLLLNKNYTAIHIRRTDYLNDLNFHHVLSIDWYDKAINLILQNNNQAKFFILGDDKEWCRQNFKQYKNITISSFTTEIEDLYAMTLCENHIISNSTFAWWGCWLAKTSNQVIAPKQWFGPSGPSYWNDIYINKWIIL